MLKREKWMEDFKGLDNRTAFAIVQYYMNGLQDLDLRDGASLDFGVGFTYHDAQNDFKYFELIFDVVGVMRDVTCKVKFYTDRIKMYMQYRDVYNDYNGDCDCMYEICDIVFELFGYDFVRCYDLFMLYVSRRDYNGDFRLTDCLVM